MPDKLTVRVGETVPEERVGPIRSLLSRVLDVQETQPGSILLRLLGFALFWDWVYLSFLSLKLSPATASVADVAEFTEISLAANAFMTLAVAFLARGALRISGIRVVRYGAPVVMCAGTLLGYFSWSALGPEPIPFLVAAIMTGIGSAGMWLCWGEAYASVSPRASALLTPLSFGLAVVLYVGLSALPPMPTLIVGALLPFASALVLPGKPKGGSATVASVSGVAPAEEKPFRPLVRLGILICAYAIAYGLTRSIGIQAFDLGEQDVGQYLLLLAVAVFSLLFVIFAYPTKRLRWASAYRVALPVILAGLLILPSLGSSYRELAGTTVRAGYTYFEILAWSTCAEISYRFRIPAYRSFGIGRGAISIGQFIGMGVGWLLASQLSLPISALATAQLVIVFVLVVVSMLFLGNPDALDSLGFQDSMPEGISFEEQSANRQKRWLARCDQVATQSALTPREREIMVMLAKGRNIPFIQKELVVSTGTVRTHVRNLYRKLEVHDRQELISLIEGCATDETES